MIDNQGVAKVFAEMADMLAIQGENAHRIRAYRRAAETISALGQPLEEIWRAGELEALPGIGKVLAAKIDELIRTGCLEAYEEQRAQVPEGVVALLRVSGVGPKRAARFWKELGVESVDALRAAAEAGRLRELPGLGASLEQQVLAGIAQLSEG